MAIPCQFLQIGRALKGEPRPVEHVSIDHCGSDIGMSKEFLDRVPKRRNPILMDEKWGSGASIHGFISVGVNR